MVCVFAKFFISNSGYLSPKISLIFKILLLTVLQEVLAPISDAKNPRNSTISQQIPLLFESRRWIPIGNRQIPPPWNPIIQLGTAFHIRKLLSESLPSWWCWFRLLSAVVQSNGMRCHFGKQCWRTNKTYKKRASEKWKSNVNRTHTWTGEQKVEEEEAFIRQSKFFMEYVHYRVPR